jgi:hypothetical protein
MQMQEIREIAKAHGLKSARLSKVALVRLIQSSEGHFDCFATAVEGECDQLGCMWREDCLGKPRNSAS